MRGRMNENAAVRKVKMTRNKTERSEKVGQTLFPKQSLSNLERSQHWPRFGALDAIGLTYSLCGKIKTEE